MSGLPISLDALLRGRVENSRIEFKAAWNSVTENDVIRTVCAFANDLQNLHGGYVVLGVEQDAAGRTLLPPRGLEDPDRVQKEVAGKCRQQIEPLYAPQIFVETVEDRHLVVVWVPSGPTPPYRAPRDNRDGKAHWVRIGSTTMEAKGEIETQLLQQSRRVPFDDQPAYQASISDISPSLVHRYLEEVRSELVNEIGRSNDEDIYERLNLLARTNGHRVPRNFALLFFNHKPERFFRGAVIEIARYSFEGDVLEERRITGPLTDQIRLAVNDIGSRVGTLRKKVEYQPEVLVSREYPVPAIEEAIANALYHRSYESMDVEPTKIHIHPDRIDVISYPGPVAGLSRQALQPDNTSRLPSARNRHIGEMLKSLNLSEQRGTGLAKIRREMERNGSPPPEFEFDDTRSWFAARLPVHPEFRVKNQLEPVIGAWVSGDRPRALEALRDQRRANPGDPIATRQLLEYLFELEAVDQAQNVARQFLDSAKPSAETTEALLVFAEGMLDRGKGVDWQSLYAKLDFTASPTAVVRFSRILLGYQSARNTALQLLRDHQGSLAGDLEYTYVLATSFVLLGPATDALRLARVLRRIDPDPHRQAVSYLMEYAVTKPADPELWREALRLDPNVLERHDRLVRLWLPSPPPL